MQLANLENKRTNISLFDANGVSWFFESVSKQNGYATQFNLVGMPIGDYVIVINRKGSQHTQALTLDDEDIAFFGTPKSNERQNGIAVLTSNSTGEKGKLVTHFTKEEGQQISVQLSNLLEQPANIHLVAPNGGIMLSKTVTGENGYGAKWDLEGMSSGNYFLYIIASDATVIQFFELNEGGIELTSQQRMERPATSEKPVFSVR